jgi:hypothetical protein
VTTTDTIVVAEDVGGRRLHGENRRYRELLRRILSAHELGDSGTIELVLDDIASELEKP